MKGKVYLVGAGPGDPELLTLKALRLIKTAEVVLHDDLITEQILALIPSCAEVRNVGKRCGQKNISQDEISRLLVQYALFGMQVVRLKSGDPLIFGRAGEEIEALREANIEFEIVPGVTAALGVAAAAQIPLTHRRISSAVTFVTGHHSAEHDFDDLLSAIDPRSTLAIYMPGHGYSGILDRLLRAGLKSTTPCALVSQATSRKQRIHRTTIEQLPFSPYFPAPSLLVVGEVVGMSAPLADDETMFRQLVTLGTEATSPDSDARLSEFQGAIE
jgi:uroporphyrin-III C-methyltransferase